MSSTKVKPRTVDVNGVDICLETLGDPDDPTILLIHGAATGMDGWDDEFCIRLVPGGRFVIRSDHRDTGESVRYEPGAPGYDANDLAEDVVGLLDELGIESAHLVGVSMGGAIAQEVTVRFPDRVRSLTLMATTAGGYGLPPPSDRFLEGVANAKAPDLSDRDAVVDHIIDSLHIYAGDNEFDTGAWRLELPGNAHLIQSDVWDEIIPAILENTSSV